MTKSVSTSVGELVAEYVNDGEKFRSVSASEATVAADWVLATEAPPWKVVAALAAASVFETESQMYCWRNMKFTEAPPAPTAVAVPVTSLVTPGPVMDAPLQ